MREREGQCLPSAGTCGGFSGGHKQRKVPAEDLALSHHQLQNCVTAV